MPTDELLSKLLESMAESQRVLADTQKATTKALESISAKLETMGGLKFDPSKLTASTKDAVGGGLRVVEPKDPTKPNLQEPLPPDQYGHIPLRNCYKCGAPYRGEKHC